VYNLPAKSVHPSTVVSLQDSFPGPLMTANRRYTVANTHSHNDYEQHTLFWMAWQAQFGSIEADIFWNGLDPIPDSAKEKILAAIARSHDLHLPVRFWDAPDFQNAWDQLTRHHFF
jgi:hypothetical protein